MKRIRTFFTVISFTLLTNVALSESLYVSDQLQAPVRASASESARITKMLTSGTKLEKLGESGQHVQVRYPGGTGWMHKSFVLDEPVARELVEDAKESIQAITRYKKEIDNNEITIAEKEQQIAELEEEKNELSQKYAQLVKVSTQSVEIDKKNTELNKENYNLKLEFNALKEDYQYLKDSSRSTEWMIGAGILFGGIFFGSVIMPHLVARLRRNKRSSWDL